MCVRKVDGFARTHAAHHCGEQLLSDALFGVGVKAMDDLSTDSTLRLEQSPRKRPTLCTFTRFFISFLRSEAENETQSVIFAFACKGKKI